MPIPIPATISGSSAATILGLNEFQTPLEKWQEIMEQLEPGFNEKQGYTLPEPFEGNASTRFGHGFESACIELTEDKLDVEITDRERVFTSGVDVVGHAIPPMSCHVDGLIEGDTLTLYEGKTASMNAFRAKWTEDKIPRTYALQVQHNMYLSGAQSAVVSCLVFPRSPDELEEMGWTIHEPDGVSIDYEIRRDGTVIDPKVWAEVLSDLGYHHIYHIERDDELIEKMLEKYSQWWTAHIIGRTPPKPMNIDDIKRLVPEPVGTIVIEDQLLIDAITEYKEIGKEVGKSGNLEKRRAQLKTMFLDHARELTPEIDDESTDKWIFRDSQGKKIASWGRDIRGYWIFR